MNNEDLKKVFKHNIKIQLYINLINSAFIVLFMIIFRKNITIVIFFLILLLAFWFYSAFKLYYLWKALKKMKDDDTTLSKVEKESSIEAVISDNNSEN